MVPEIMILAPVSWWPCLAPWYLVGLDSRDFLEILVSQELDHLGFGPHNSALGMSGIWVPGSTRDFGTWSRGGFDSPPPPISWSIFSVSSWSYPSSDSLGHVGPTIS